MSDRMIMISEAEYKQLKRKANTNPFAHEDEDKKFLQNVAGLMFYALYQNASGYRLSIEDFKAIIKHADELGYTDLSTINPQTHLDKSKIVLRYVRKGKT